MTYFTTSKIFLVPSFELDVKEREKIEKFLLFLENSQVGNVITKYVKNNTSKGGRPNCNYYRLFAAILFGFAFDKYTLREIEKACKFDLRYITIMEQTFVNYSTISKFINNVIVPNEKEVFSLICKQLKRELNIAFEDAFIDGTKIEANANKYKFVWKPLTYHEKLSIKAYELIFKYNLLQKQTTETHIRSSIIATSLSNLENIKSTINEKEYTSISNALSSMLSKVLEYESKEEICGPNRNSYYKTDHDATAMCLKSDYYSGLGTNMHAAYNIQSLVIKGFVFSYYVSQSRTDFSDFIPVLEAFYLSYNTFPERVCADSGYGNLINYRYIKEHNIENYIKYPSWEGNITGRSPDCYYLNDDETIKCLNGNIGQEINIENRHPKKANAVFFKITGCNSCEFKSYCKRFMKTQNEDFKIFEVVKELQFYKQEATKNLLSTKGIEIRVNRSIQVEGVFGIVKQDYKRNRFNRRGKNKISTEVMLYFLGLNIAKLFRYYETGELNKYWESPENLSPQEIKKPSAKRLNKKGLKMNNDAYKKG